MEKKKYTVTLNSEVQAKLDAYIARNPDVNISKMIRSALDAYLNKRALTPAQQILERLKGE